ncbi:hypothetical protein K501DRAFT_272751 [Backusella circina FSU 941]|nr:hypothetical protein K501DRAFT_280521 [Backusella circina FSU 941]KAI8883348.1 hypothetical protein K501DRAFT_272751 [Backusella circina FSU 941]
MLSFVKKAIASACILNSVPKVSPSNLFRKIPAGPTEICLGYVSVSPNEEDYVYVHALNNTDTNLNLTEGHEVYGFVTFENRIQEGNLCDVPKSMPKIKCNHKMAIHTPESIKYLQSSICDTVDSRYDDFFPTEPIELVSKQQELKEEHFEVLDSAQQIAAQQRQHEIDQMIKEHCEEFPTEAVAVKKLANDYDALKKYISWSNSLPVIP